jgi:hypothetical protein
MRWLLGFHEENTSVYKSVDTDENVADKVN